MSPLSPMRGVAQRSRQAKRRARRWPTRAGLSLVEMLVALTLLTTTLGIALPLLVRHGRLLMSCREYQWALDELTNQCDRLAALPSGERTAALEQLAPSQFAAEHLPGAQLRADRVAQPQGDRVTLSLTWDEPQRQQAPVRLTVWLNGPAQPAPATPAAANKETQP